MLPPRLGGEQISPQEANRLYNDAQTLFKRYEPKSSIDRSEVDPSHRIDPNDYTIHGNDKVIGVVRGNVFDRDMIIKDLTRLGALYGRLSEIWVDLKSALRTSEFKLDAIKARLYNLYTGQAHRGEVPLLSEVGKTKLTKENITGLVINDTDYKEAWEIVERFENNVERAESVLKSIIELQNDLKIASKSGENAQ